MVQWCHDFFLVLLQVQVPAVNLVPSTVPSLPFNLQSVRRTYTKGTSSTRIVKPLSLFQNAWVYVAYAFVEAFGITSHEYRQECKCECRLRWICCTTAKQLGHEKTYLLERKYIIIKWLLVPSNQRRCS